MKQRSSFSTIIIVGLIGAVIGSFAMMLYASTHFAGVAGPNNTPPSAIAAPIAGYKSDQDRIVAAVKRAEPSVVALNVTVNGVQVVPNDPMSQFFGGGKGGSSIRRFRAKASGSGFVYNNQGFIITNAHVVSNASQIQVVFQNGDRVPARIYATDPAVDLALIKVENYAKLPVPLDFGNSDKLEQGQWAIAIGEPLELKQTVTVGVVSGFNRDETIGSESGIPREYKGLMQTSAPINPGNSGGPLLDIDGRVIGVNQSTASPSYAQGIGFAIPINQVKTVIERLEKNPRDQGSSQRGFLGVQMTTIDNNIRQQINYLGSGVAITNVVGGSAADQAGLEPGDVIQALEGQPVRSPADVTKAIGAHQPGDSVTLRVWSGGNVQNVTVKIGERPM